MSPKDSRLDGSHQQTESAWRHRALIYLHGFASGPEGNKARHCRAWAEAQEIPFLAPDLNLPSFEALTLSAQVEAVESLLTALVEAPVLVGSSLGGLVAAAVAQRGASLHHLVLLAPAFGFAQRRLDSARWAGYRHHRRLPVFHHAWNRWVRMGPELLDDLPRWRDDETWMLQVPGTVLHGIQDEAVPLAESEAFLIRHPHWTLKALEDDHGLLKAESLAALDACLTAAFATSGSRIP